MDREEEILAALRGLKESQEVILAAIREIRETSDARYAENKAHIQQIEERNKKTMKDYTKSKRGLTILLVIAAGIFVLTWVIPAISSVHEIFRNPALRSMIPTKSIDTSAFDGTYAVDKDASFTRLKAQPTDGDPKKEKARDEFVELMTGQYSDFRIQHGVITSGKDLVQEFRLAKAEIKGNTLEGTALWHEDVGDPGDCVLIKVRLELDGDQLRFYFYMDGENPRDPVVLKRQKP